MRKFTVMAERAIADYRGGGIDSHLAKIAKDNNLNPDEHQRLVEEYNVGKFLSKLQDNTQHEEFDVASPVSTPSVGLSDGGVTSLKKVASAKYNIDPSMFYVEWDEDTTSLPTLQKVASVDIDGGDLFSSERKWEDADAKREEAASQYGDGIRRMTLRSQKDMSLGLLAKEASFSPGLAKAIVATLAKTAGEDEALTVIESCKFSTEEIAGAQIEEMPADVVDLIRGVM